MFRELIDRLKINKKQLQNASINNDVIKKELEEKNVDITVSTQDNISKIEISDYISIGVYVEKIKSMDEYNILDLLCNCVLWNNFKQKVNKGIYYVITIDKCIYNILFTNEQIIIDERINKELDEQTQKENIIQERVIRYNINKSKYHYYSAKHESNRNTYYTKYYDRNREYSLGLLDLTDDEAYEEIGSVIYNLEHIKGIEKILDIDLLKENILNDLSKLKSGL